MGRLRPVIHGDRHNASGQDRLNCQSTRQWHMRRFPRSTACSSLPPKAECYVYILLLSCLRHPTSLHSHNQHAIYDAPRRLRRHCRRCRRSTATAAGESMIPTLQRAADIASCRHRCESYRRLGELAVATAVVTVASTVGSHSRLRVCTPSARLWERLSIRYGAGAGVADPT